MSFTLAQFVRCRYRRDGLQCDWSISECMETAMSPVCVNHKNTSTFKPDRHCFRIGARICLLVALLLSLPGCIPSQLEKSRSEAFRQYEIIVRWSQWDAAADFISPEYLEEHPITKLEMDRLRLFKVTQYVIRSVNVTEEGMAATQVVEIKLFNTNQGVERSIIDEQMWRFDESSKRWRLHSPLPDPTQGR